MKKAYTKRIIEEFAKDDGPDLMIVVDKLLTGFDEPKTRCCTSDKPLKLHNLYPRHRSCEPPTSEERVYYLIDYRGILKELDATIADYRDLGRAPKVVLISMTLKAYTAAWILNIRSCQVFIVSYGHFY